MNIDNISYQVLEKYQKQIQKTYMRNMNFMLYGKARSWWYENVYLFIIKIPIWKRGGECDHIVGIEWVKKGIIKTGRKRVYYKDDN